MRISKQTKRLIGYRVASRWVEAAREILAEGLKPAKLSETVEKDVWLELVRLFGEEAAFHVSRRVFNELIKWAKHEAKMMVS